MQVETWQVITVAVSIIGLTVVLIGHIVRYAYQQGKTEQRLEAVEGASASHGEMRELLAKLSAMVGGMNESIQELKAAIHEIAPRSIRGRTQA